jgi:hypothetical protein
MREFYERIGAVMDSGSRTSFDRALSRRQFAWIVGGGAMVLVGGGTYGLVARSEQSAETTAKTAFGAVAVLRAGRFSRLDAQGRAASSLAATASLLSSGTLRGGDQPLQPAGAVGEVDGHGHGGPQPWSQGLPQPVNLTWGDVVVLDVELHNRGQEPVLFSPGQLRLRLLPAETTITPQDSDRSPGVLGPNSKERVLISYLAPHDLTRLELEFSDEQNDQVVQLALPALTVNGARS